MTELARLELHSPDDVASARHVASRAARALGLETPDVTRLATSVSELSRWLAPALPVQLTFAVRDLGAASALRIEFRFDRPVEEVRATPGQQAPTVVARLVDELELGASGVTITKLLSRRVDESELAAARGELLTDRPRDLRAALQSQNEELISALLLLRERESELVRVNAELDQTNRGVVALYAELEQRAADVRSAQRAVFEELEGALRPPPPAMADLELAVRYLPAQRNSPTGGDLYDWFVLPDGTLHITVVDVRGHGVESTRDALHVTHAVRTLSLEGHLIGQLLQRADALFRKIAEPVVATVLLARLDPRDGTLRLAGGGHPRALRLPVVGEPEYLDAPGRPLGYEGAGSRQVTTAQLAAGDTVLFYTDGLIEIRHDIVEGMDTLAAGAGMATRLPLPQLLDTTLATCLRGDELHDDTLLIGARWRPE